MRSIWLLTVVLADFLLGTGYCHEQETLMSHLEIEEVSCQSLDFEARRGKSGTLFVPGNSKALKKWHLISHLRSFSLNASSPLSQDVDSDAASHGGRTSCLQIGQRPLSRRFAQFSDKSWTVQQEESSKHCQASQTRDGLLWKGVPGGLRWEFYCHLCFFLSISSNSIQSIYF